MKAHVLTNSMISKRDELRFWEKVEITDGCWNWLATGGDAYGRFKMNGLNYLAHRFSWALEFGAVDPLLTVDHLCQNTRCVRPDHLSLVPIEVNSSRSHLFREPKTHCKWGHEFTPDNIRWDGPEGNHRICRRCTKERMARWRAQRRSAAGG